MEMLSSQFSSHVALISKPWRLRPRDKVSNDEQGDEREKLI